MQRAPGDLSRSQRRPAGESLALDEEANSTNSGEHPAAVEEEAVLQLTKDVMELQEMIKSLQSSVEAQVSACCSSCESSTTTTTTTFGPRPGLCAAFGDPHFTTFDGANTILLAEQTCWLVKSERVWIQASSKEVTGNIMGIAVGGPFMSGHTLILYNSTEFGGLRALFDGQPILTDWDENGNAEFQSPFKVWAARRSEWDTSLHDKEILQMDPAINFSVSTWPNRFQNSPQGGLYLFRFPDGIEVTATGVDFMSAVVKMLPEKSGQVGYCGNFNGSPDDEFLPPIEGSVPPFLAAAWNRPVGEALGRVDDVENLFKMNNETISIIDDMPSSSLAQLKESPLKLNCEKSRMLKAGEVCEGLPDLFMWKACVIDVCLTGKREAAHAVALAEMLELKVNARGIPVFVGHGRCRDIKGQKFRARPTKGVKTYLDCMMLLRDLAAIHGVMGAQLEAGGTCQVLLDKKMDVHGIDTVVPPNGGWGDETSVKDASGRGFISGVAEDKAWSCWRLN